ncbi:hypothetical protein ACFOZ7_17575 [Natribaculum luteum]|uniref:Uncharacterized protein n=1 Tax=Natribaculum luteum TaxID=1586232 RepID=A0ABD5P386_9EURY|nr:hypothetical protein [Natribaculum luteum]
MSDERSGAESLPIHQHPLWRTAHQNLAISETDARAAAHYASNTLLLNVPPNDLADMTVMYALVSREEFMHGEWNEALLNTAAHLRHAAADYLLALLHPDRDSNDAYLRAMLAALQVADEIDRVTGPFIEAVDRFHIISTIGNDDEYYRSVKENYEAVVDEDDTTDITDKLNREIEEQRALARGESTVTDARTVVQGGQDRASTEYVNPLYYHALTEIAKTDWSTANEIGERTLSTYTRSGLLIAEEVAKAVLDVPYPIEPLGSLEASELFDPDTVDVEPKSLDDLQAIVTVDDEAYDHYLRRYESRVDLQVAPARTWLSDLFVQTVRELERIAAEEPVTAKTGDELRRQLVEGVFETEVGSTMRDQQTPLLEVPQRAQAAVPEQHFSDLDYEPLPKLLVEAFEKHGAFASVLYRPLGDRANSRTRYQYNYNMIGWELDQDRYTLPPGVETYRELWERYFVGDVLINEVLKRRDEYRTHLVEQLGTAFDTRAALKAAVDGRGDPDRSDNENEFNLLQRDRIDSILSDPGVFDPVEVTKEYTTGRLLWAVEEAEIPHTSIDEFDFTPVQCPLCAVQRGSCGTDGCRNQELVKPLNAPLSTYVARLLTAEFSEVTEEPGRVRDS